MKKCNTFSVSPVQPTNYDISLYMCFTTAPASCPFACLLFCTITAFVCSLIATVLVVLGEKARPVTKLLWYVAVWRGAPYVYDHPSFLSSTFLVDMHAVRG